MTDFPHIPTGLLQEYELSDTVVLSIGGGVEGVPPSTEKAILMPMCSWCGKTSREVHTHDNGRTKLQLCTFCQAEYELKHGPGMPPPPPPEPAWKRWFRKIFG